jgi:single-strand DNA-binding protein
MKAIIQTNGFLGGDAEYKTTPNGTLVCNFSIAYKQWNGKDKEPSTIWYNCTAFNDVARNIEDYAKKGKFLIINGELKINPYIDKQGMERVSYDVTVHSFDFPPVFEKSENNNTQNQGYQRQNNQNQGYRNNQQNGGYQNNPQNGGYQNAPNNGYPNNGYPNNGYQNNQQNNNAPQNFAPNNNGGYTPYTSDDDDDFPF